MLPRKGSAPLPEDQTLGPLYTGILLGFPDSIDLVSGVMSIRGTWSPEVLSLSVHSTETLGLASDLQVYFH